MKVEKMAAITSKAVEGEMIEKDSIPRFLETVDAAVKEHKDILNHAEKLGVKVKGAASQGRKRKVC